MLVYLSNSSSCSHSYISFFSFFFDKHKLYQTLLHFILTYISVRNLWLYSGILQSQHMLEYYFFWAHIFLDYLYSCICNICYNLLGIVEFSFDSNIIDVCSFYESRRWVVMDSSFNKYQNIVRNEDLFVLVFYFCFHFLF